MGKLYIMVIRYWIHYCPAANEEKCHAGSNLMHNDIQCLYLYHIKQKVCEEHLILLFAYDLQLWHRGSHLLWRQAGLVPSCRHICSMFYSDTCPPNDWDMLGCQEDYSRCRWGGKFIIKVMLKVRSVVTNKTNDMMKSFVEYVKLTTSASLQSN